jgi:SAM-dependent methyltransferase
VRDQLLELLRCPACRAERALELDARERDEYEVREGALNCGACGRSFAVEEGIADLLHDPPDFVVREGAGLGRFAEMMRNEGWDRAKILSLPDLEDPYWYGQRTSYDQLLSRVDFAPGETLLDVGSNTCWASNLFARLGLEVIALDITKTEMQGLRTAEYFIDSGEVFFERVLSNMADPAIASDSLDYVFCCEVLHHNDLAAMRRTFKEIHRILKPGGKLLVINEPMRFPLMLKRDHAVEVAHWEGNENVHFFHQYFLGARSAGFGVRVLPPAYMPAFSGHPAVIALDASPRLVAGELVRYVIRRFRPIRWSYLAWKTLIAGDCSLSMICTKAGSPLAGETRSLKEPARVT